MWSRKISDDKVKYSEKYIDELTGRKRDVSTTLSGKDTAKNRKLAHQILTEKIQAKQEPTASTVTLKQIFDEYLEDSKSDKKLSTCRKKDISLRKCVELIGNDVLVSKLTAHVVRKGLQKSGKKESTLNEYLTLFRAMIRWAYKEDMIEDISFLNKLEDFKVKEKKKDVSEKYMEQDELRELIKNLQHPIWKEVILFGALTGMRIGEIVALEKTDVNLDAMVIRISKNYDHNNAVVTDTKNIASNDTISIQDELVPVIHRINSLMSRQKLRCGYRSNLFLCDEKGKHIHYAALNKYFAENTERILGKRLTLHSLRHTHASLLFEQGFSVQEVQRRLRHGMNSKITEQIYIHVTQKLRQKDAEKLKNVSLL